MATVRATSQSHSYRLCEGGTSRSWLVAYCGRLSSVSTSEWYRTEAFQLPEFRTASLRQQARQPHRDSELQSTKPGYFDEAISMHTA